MTGRPSIPEAVVIDSRSRGVLDTPPARGTTTWCGAARPHPPRLPRVAVVKQAMPLPNAPVDILALAKDLRAGHRAALARAITLIESRRGDHQAAARELVQALLPDTGRAAPVGLTSPPRARQAPTRDAPRELALA